VTPREKAAEAAGFPHDITFGELREELTRAWAIVDKQSKQLERPGYLLVSEAELATALDDGLNAMDDEWVVSELAAAIFAALVAAQEKGETGS